MRKVFVHTSSAKGVRIVGILAHVVDQQVTNLCSRQQGVDKAAVKRSRGDITAGRFDVRKKVIGKCLHRTVFELARGNHVITIQGP